MSKISEFKTAMDAFNARLQDAVLGIEKDLESLAATIADLQASPGQITAEDQAMLDELQLKAEEATTKIEALNALNPPIVPPAEPA